jgi:tetratricopeptide (TPR) repeat protein
MKRSGLVMLASAVLFLASGCRESAKSALNKAADATYEKRPHDALTYYRRALDVLEADGSPESAVLKARALRGAADIYYLELRDTKHAIEVYRELIRQCPVAPETMQGRIFLADLLQVYRRDLRAAIAELAAAVERNPPESAQLSYRIAKLYFELGDYQQADLEAKKVQAKYETSSFVDDAMFLQGQALGMMGEAQREESAKAFEKLVGKFPDSELQPHALFEWGKVRAENREDEKAIDLWVRALVRHPDPALVQSNIARVRRRIAATTPIRIGDHTAAFDKPVAARPKDGVLAPKVELKRHRTSVEAAGGTAEEAARDRGD